MSQRQLEAWKQVRRVLLSFLNDPLLKTFSVLLEHRQSALKAVKNPIFLNAGRQILVPFFFIVSLSSALAFRNKLDNDCRCLPLPWLPAQSSPDDSIGPPSIFKYFHGLLKQRSIYSVAIMLPSSSQQ